MNAEQTEIIGTFAHLLRGPTEDGGRKRERRDNPKPLWKVDPDHMNAFYRHLRRGERGELRDADSGSLWHVHAGWRLLATAAQLEHQGEPGWIALDDSYCPDCRSLTRSYRDKLWMTLPASSYGATAGTWVDCTNEWHDATG